MPRSGCPVSTEFFWSEGLLQQDTEDLRPSNNWSSSFHLNGENRDSTILQHFCVKTNDTGKTQWPAGKYCIYKKEKCPYGKDIRKKKKHFHHFNTSRKSVPLVLFAQGHKKVSKSGSWERCLLSFFITVFRFFTKWGNPTQLIPTHYIVIAYVMLQGRLAALKIFRLYSYVENFTETSVLCKTPPCV